MNQEQLRIMSGKKRFIAALDQRRQYAKGA